jgi:hypothetical protein
MPDNILSIIEASVERYPDDIEEAVEFSINKVQSLPEYTSFVQTLVTDVIRRYIHEVRHDQTRKVKRSLGLYGCQSKIKTTSSTVSAVYSTIYDKWFIAGKSLGSITGEELPKIAASERMKSSGHIINARLCEELVPLVFGKNTVRDSVHENKLKAIVKKIEKENRAC